MLKGLGGAECTVTHIVLLTIYMKGTDGRYTQLVRPFHIFKKLSVPLLIGNDIMKPEKFDLLYSTNWLRIGACDSICVQITVYSGSKYSRVPVHCTESIVIPASSSVVVGVKFGRVLERNQDYPFAPLHSRSAVTGTGASHAVVRHYQKSLLYTNFEAMLLTIFKGLVLGHVRSLETSASLAWLDASNDIKALFGVTCKSSLAFTATEVFDPHQTDGLPVSNGPRHELHGTLRGEPRPQPVPTLSNHTILDGEYSCTSESFGTLQWLLQEYVPQYEHELPWYIKVPDKATSTCKQVIVDTEDDISPAQIDALQSLVRRHRNIFNDIMGYMRETEEDWLRIEVLPEFEVSLKPTGLYRLTACGHAALDEQFNLNREYGRMAALDKPSPWDLKVFIVYRGTKAQPFVDMRKLNTTMIGDTYPLPQQQEVIQVIQGMRWLGSADITSTFYQHLIYPAHRYRTVISTHMGVTNLARQAPWRWRRCCSHPCCAMARPRLRGRSCGHPLRLEKRLALSPRYRSGSDIPQRLHPTAGRSRSFSFVSRLLCLRVHSPCLLCLLFPVDYPCASFSGHRYVCCSSLIMSARRSSVAVSPVCVCLALLARPFSCCLE